MQQRRRNATGSLCGKPILAVSCQCRLESLLLELSYNLAETYQTDRVRSSGQRHPGQVGSLTGQTFSLVHGATGPQTSRSEAHGRRHYR